MAKKLSNPPSDEEVAIIKNLLIRGQLTKQEILGYINRARANPSKNLNPGRIAEINQGTVKKYLPIKPANDELVDEFLKKYYAAQNEDPLSKNTLDKLLPIKSLNPLILDITETSIIECKEVFQKQDGYIKTIAAFANNSGGYLVFGIEDKSWQVVGMQNDNFEKYDLKELNQHIHNCLNIDLQIGRHIFILENKKIGILYIPPAKIKPVIFSSQRDGISIGQIYYRYPGENRLITALDLHRLIEERASQLSKTLLIHQLNGLLQEVSSHRFND